MANFEYDKRAICLHCHTGVQLIRTSSGPSQEQYSSDEKETLDIFAAQCPICDRLIITIEEMQVKPGIGLVPKSEYVVWPISSGRPQAPPEVPENIASDFTEASLVLPFSAKASAALSRRCLQSVLSDVNAGNTISKNLSKQIDEVLNSGKLPSLIAQSLDAVREIGNFATHEQKSINTGEILDVEDEEAEWNLDVLDSLFDFYYVKPSIERKKLKELNKKLKEAGRDLLDLPPEDTDTDRTDIETISG